MAKVERFEELEVWRKAREFAKHIHETSCKGTFAKDFSLKDQINRAAGSIMDNIAEGFERGGNKELIQFLYIAKGSAGEARSQLVRAFDKCHIEQNVFVLLSKEAVEISSQLSGFINYLRSSDKRGEKFVREPDEHYLIYDSTFEVDSESNLEH